MSDFGTMQSRIADELNKTNLTAQIKRSIVTAMNRYRHKRFKFNYASSTFTSSVGLAEYPLPDGYMGDEIVEVLDGNFNDSLEKVDYSWIVSHDNHTSYQSEPRKYAILDGSNVRLFPVPDNSGDTSGNYVLVWHYHKDLNAAGASNAISICATSTISNAWTTDGEELIRLEAKIDIYTNVLRGAESKKEAQFLIPLRNQALRALIKEYEQAVSSGTVQSYDRRR